MEQDSSEKVSLGRWFAPSLVTVTFLGTLSGSIFILLNVDIAATFQVPVGVTSQLSTVSSAAQVVVGLLMGFLIVRFRLKSLIVVALVVEAISGVGIFLAPTLSWMQVFFAIGGISSVMAPIAVITLIGDLLSSNKKAKVVSWIFAAAFLASLVGAFMVNFFADVGGWRFSFLMLNLPTAVVSLVIVFFSVPSRTHAPQPKFDKGAYVRSFKQVLLNKSAAACLIAGVLTVGTTAGIFLNTFWRLQYLLPREYTVYMTQGVMVTAIVGSLVGGRLVNKFGRKPLAVAATLVAGVLGIAVWFAPNLWTALALSFLSVVVSSIGGVAFTCLVLDQVPKSRGTMMSLNHVFGDVGNTIQPAVGGALLVLFASDLLFSYQAVGLVFAAMTFATAAIIYFLTKDPPKAQMQTPPE